MAINYASHNDYGVLTKPVKKLSSKLSWGISFEKAFFDFAKETKSKLIYRAIATIIEVYRSGGKIAEGIDKVGHSSFKIDALKKEQRATIYSIILRGYIIYFIFIIVLMGMIKFLIPELIIPITTNYQTINKINSLISFFQLFIAKDNINLPNIKIQFIFGG